MNDDAALLRHYAEEGSEAAFTELVRRCVDLVYSVALRRTGGDAHHAADVAQQVFTALARDARKLSRHTVLGAWLHTATRNAALNLMISEQRRQVRERAVLDPALTSDGSADAPDWDRLRPVLDAAIDELPEADRSAVVLRFLERKPFSEIGRVLRVTEDAARMRTDRAVEKLRTALARRGITSTAAALGAVVSSQSLVSAPAGLAATLSSQSLVASVGTSAGLFAAFTAIMSTKIIATAAVSALLAFGVGTYFGRTHRTAAAEQRSTALGNPQLAQLITSLRQDNHALKAENDRLKADVDQVDTVTARLAELKHAPPTPAPVGATLGLARWEVQKAALNNLRQIDAARKQFQIDNGFTAPSIHQLVGRGGYIKAVRTVDGEDYSKVSMTPGEPMTVTTPDGIAVTFDPTGATTTRPDEPSQTEMQHLQELSARVLAPSTKALEAYRTAHNGSNPPNEEAVLPYFATPEEGADFVEFLKAKRAAGL